MLDTVLDILYVNVYPYRGYVIFPLLSIAACIMLFRLSRTFPTYVKTGKLGDSDNCIFLSSKGFSWKVFLTETHPGAILLDSFVISAGLGIAYMGFWFIPYIIAIVLISRGVYKFAVYSRERYIKKQEFHEKLKSG
jgi:hypothetical protein